MVKIEVLEREDLGIIVPLVEAFGRESCLLEQFEATLDMDHFMRQLEVFYANETAFGLVALEGGEPVGVLPYLMSPDLFTNSMIANEIMWYVKKSHRETPTGARLFKAYERDAKRRGADYALMVHLENSMPERLKRFYDRCGYAPIETHYLKLL